MLTLLNHPLCVWLAVACTLGSAAVRAQDAAAPNDRKSGLEVRLLAVELLAGAESVVLRSGETNSAPIELPTHGLSEGIRVAGRELAVAAPPKDGNPGRILARAALPDSGRRFLLLLVPAKDSYGCRVVALDDPAFKPGGVCFVNLSPLTVGGLLGNLKFVAEQGQPLIMNPPAKQDLPYYQVSFYYQNGEGSRQFANTRWPYGIHTRSYVFFYIKPNSTRVTYRAVDEIVADS
jgi:hypothetical protein